MIGEPLAERAQQLRAERVAFACATVVGVRRPTSVRPGDSAIVLGDGTVEGFVGGVCAEESVRMHGLRVLETGEPLLLRLLPDAGSEIEEAVEGTVTAHNPCLSGGAMEIFLEPCLPAPRLIVVGDAPVARALCELAPRVGFDVAAVADGPVAVDARAAALVVASHGRGEEAALGAALREGVPYVGLVASRQRGDGVRAALDVPEALRSRLCSPVGLDIGARSPAEIALSVLAEIVQERTRPPQRVPAGTAPKSAASPAASGGCCHGPG